MARTLRSTARSAVRLLPLLAALVALPLAAACGSDGSDGATGATGATGKDGINGKDGTNGTNGKDGVNGTNGKDGVNGTNGKDGATGKDGADGKDAAVDPALSPLEKAYAGVGGKDALKAITSLTLSSSGVAWVVSEGLEPDDVRKVATYKAETKHDLASGGLRVDYERDVNFFGFPQPLKYQEIIKGNLGVVSGTVSILGAPAGDMTSDRWASSHKTHRLLNPQLILKDVVDGKLTATEGDPAVLDGVLHQLVVVADPVAPLSLWVSAQTGRLSKLSTIEHDPVLRDVPLEVFYADWQPSAQGLHYPTAVYVARDGVILRQEARSAFADNQAIDAKTFDFPAGAKPAYDEKLAKVGALSSQVNQMFAGVGIPLDGLQTFVQPVQVSPGVWQLLGGSHNTMVVEQASGLVVADAPLYNERTDAILAWAKQQYPSKPVKWVTLTHFHDDHIGGLRAYAAEGVTIVVGSAAKEYILKSLTAPSTLVPDKLATSGGNYTIVSVAKGDSFTIDDATRPVTSYNFESGHADGMMMVHVPSAKILWATDIYSAIVPVPAPAPNPLAQQLYSAIADKKLDVQTLITGHGNGANTFAEFKATIGL